MEEEKKKASASASVGGGESSASRASSSFVKAGDRQMFTVELRPGETTIVSWKKLLKDANKVNGSASTSAPEPPANAHPALESRLAPVSLSLSLSLSLALWKHCVIHSVDCKFYQFDYFLCMWIGGALCTGLHLLFTCERIWVRNHCFEEICRFYFLFLNLNWVCGCLWIEWVRG